jgi:hypothetical protein
MRKYFSGEQQLAEKFLQLPTNPAEILGCPLTNCAAISVNCGG